MIYIWAIYNRNNLSIKYVFFISCGVFLFINSFCSVLSNYNRFSYTTGSWAFNQLHYYSVRMLWAYYLSILQPVENIFKVYSLLSQRKIASTHLKPSLKPLSSTAFLDTLGHICRCQSGPACCLLISQIPHIPCQYAKVYVPQANWSSSSGSYGS